MYAKITKATPDFLKGLSAEGKLFFRWEHKVVRGKNSRIKVDYLPRTIKPFCTCGLTFCVCYTVETAMFSVSKGQLYMEVKP